MKHNDNYREVRAEAQAKANATGFDHGVERDAFGFRCFMLPARENRCVFERQCEVVHCEQVEDTQPGHGPERRVGQ
jgi:hypothetical protein